MGDPVIAEHGATSCSIYVYLLKCVKMEPEMKPRHLFCVYGCFVRSSYCMQLHARLDVDIVYVCVCMRVCTCIFPTHFHRV